MTAMTARSLALTCLCIPSLLVGSALVSAAAEPGESHAEALRRRVEELEKREAEQERQRRQWQQRERDQVEAIRKAREKLEKTEAARVRARDGAYQGVKRSDWTRRAREAEEEVTRTERELEALYEEARKADVPPGWLGDGIEDAFSED
jgi:hypothetical protein